MRIRLQNALDSIAGDISYHSRCPLKHTKHGYSDNGIDKDQCKTEDTVFNQLRKDIISRVCRGQAVLVSDCWERYKALCEEYSLPNPYYFEANRKFFRYKLIQLVPNACVIHLQSNDIEMSSSYPRHCLPKMYVTS